jgi:uncharacterized membrane protein
VSQGPTTSNNAEIEAQIALREEITRQISPLLPGDNPAQKAVIAERISSILVSEKFSGPIAHPRHLAEYEKVCPGAADRIIAMAEAEMASRMEAARAHTQLLQQDQADERDDRRRGMQFGLATIGGLIFGALFCVVWGQPWVAGAFLGTGLFAAAVAFIKGREKD